MKNGNTTTIDKNGRIVIPKEIRKQANLEPGMPLRVAFYDGRVEIEPEPLEVEIVKEGLVSVAVPKRAIPKIKSSTVRRIIEEIRDEPYHRAVDLMRGRR
jgi:AbrB family looped-hinge helix DNA binding protein